MYCGSRTNAVTLQDELHASPSFVLPSSHSSPAAALRTPSPHAEAVQSGLHVGDGLPPASHCSPGSTFPSPHVAGAPELDDGPLEELVAPLLELPDEVVLVAPTPPPAPPLPDDEGGAPLQPASRTIDETARDETRQEIKPSFITTSSRARSPRSRAALCYAMVPRVIPDELRCFQELSGRALAAYAALMSSVDKFTMPVMQELFTNHELLAREAARPNVDVAGGVKKVCVVGGGTAGWFTALALRAQLPSLEVTVVESPSIPIIGVGEATVPSIVSFLHHYLKLDVHDFTRAVKPTWKQGIRFEWGLPGSYVFQAPFDWEVNGIGMLGSMGETGDVSSFTVQAMLMAKDVTPILREKGQLQSFLPLFSFAYHLDNERLVAYLVEAGRARGITRIESKILDAPIREGGAPDEPEIARLVLDDGRTIEADLYVDCSGFASLLLGQKLGVPFHSYASSLFTDRALAFNAPHGGKLKSFTTARTMENGWCWCIPMVEDDHLGYVFASSHCTEEQAFDEIRRLHPSTKNERVVRFRSGRHDRIWVGNVFGVGNSFAFVEPLESTGLLMITRAVTSLVRAFPITQDCRVMKQFVNGSLGRDWDRLRWFLAAHYKFNKRLDSTFWADVREKVDVSGIQTALDIFQAMGPLSLLPRAIRTSVNELAEVYFYGLAGLDCILLGQKVPFPKLEREPSAVWRARRQTAQELVRRALPQAEALEATWARREWLDQLVNHPSSWVVRAATYL